LQAGSRLAISSGLTLPSALTQCRTTQQWRQFNSGAMPEGLNNQTPAVFAIGA
jgi:16S rRNA (cytidine1402-2'-O)-methyltransferase